MSHTTFAAVLAFSALCLDVRIGTSGEVWASVHHNGREYNIIATGLRTTVYACQTGPGANDGFEVCRTYGEPSEAIPTALSRLAAA